MTWQTKDIFQLLPTSPAEDDNGEVGSPQWVGDFRLRWAANGGTTLFYGMNVIGGTSNVQEFVDRNGDVCVNNALRGTYCAKLTTKAVFYHNASVTQEIRRPVRDHLGGQQPVQHAPAARVDAERRDDLDDRTGGRRVAIWVQRSPRLHKRQVEVLIRFDIANIGAAWQHAAPIVFEVH